MLNYVLYKCNNNNNNVQAAFQIRTLFNLIVNAIYVTFCPLHHERKNLQMKSNIHIHGFIKWQLILTFLYVLLRCTC